MTSADVDRIERELSVRLPDSYRKAVVNYPVPAFAGNSEVMFWDDADALIKYNLRLRAGEESFVDPWPSRFFALGRDGGGCSDALDLDDELAGVFWFDRAHVSEEIAKPSGEKLSEWLCRQVEEMSEYLSELEIDLDSEPAERNEKEAQQGKASGWLIVFFLVLIIFVGIFYTFIRD
jgi:hypothetical protein